MATGEKWRSVSAVCGLLAGPVLFVATGAAALAQPDDFSLVNHEPSDLGAMTANTPWLANQFGSNLPGLLLFLFAVGLWHSLGYHRSAQIGSMLVALVGLGIFFSGLLRLDCRHIDSGCNPQSSWHANAHVADAAFIALALVLAPFVLARALKFAPEWRDLSLPTLVFGIGTIVAAVVGDAIGAGAASLVGVLPWFAWITILAARMSRLARASEPPASRVAASSAP